MLSKTKNIINIDKSKDRNFILFYINGKRFQINGDQVFITLSDFLRNQIFLKGTKVVCSEGDCGACTVLITDFLNKTGQAKSLYPLKFKTINSCLVPLYLLDSTFIFTIDACDNIVQKEIINNFATQCGFCTPGFVMSLMDMVLNNNKNTITVKKIKNYLTGNLCRCTGYQQIIDAGLAIANNTEKLYDSIRSSLFKQITQNDFDEISETKQISIKIENSNDRENNHKLFSPTKLEELNNISDNFTVVSSATDLGVLINKRDHKIQNILSLQLVNQLYEIKIDKHNIEIGAKVSISRFQKNIKIAYPEIYNFLKLFASPQIKNFATLAGNIANASPIGDTILFLKLLNAKIEIFTPQTNSDTDLKKDKLETRIVDINDFYLGYKQCDLKKNEIITKIIINKIKYNSLKLYKVSNRRDLDISTINAGFMINFHKSDKSDKSNASSLSKSIIIDNIKIAYGGVSATVLRLYNVEIFLINKQITRDLINQAAEKIEQQIKPLSDLRGSQKYRLLLARNLFFKFMDNLLKQQSINIDKSEL